MSDNTSNEGSAGDGFKPITTQEEFDQAIKARLGREYSKAVRETEAKYADVLQKAAKLDELEAASKTELEKAQERATKAEQELARFQAQAERRAAVEQVAAETGLPAELIADFSGDTKEELAEKAARHAGAFKTPAAPIVNDVRKGGAPSAGTETSGDIFASFASKNLFK